MEEMRSYIELAIVAIATFAFSWVWVGVIKPFLEKKFTAEQLNEIMRLVKLAVEAAEQLPFLADKPGSDKKTYVQNFLRERSVTVDDALLDAMIESAVYEVNLAKGDIT